MFLRIETDQQFKSINIVFNNSKIKSTVSSSFNEETKENIDEINITSEQEELYKRNFGLYDETKINHKNSKSTETIFNIPDISDRKSNVDPDFANKDF